MLRSPLPSQLLRTTNTLGNGTSCVSLTQRRHKHVHRTIQIQLKADIPGLGKYGSIQKVGPGRMRNSLYPQGLANYVLKGVAPKLMEPRPIDASTLERAAEPVNTPEIDYAGLRTELEQIRRLTIHRRVIPTESSIPSSTTQFSHFSHLSVSQQQPIFGAATSHDVELALRSANPHLDLRLTEAGASVHVLLPGSERAAKGWRVKTTGDFSADVTLRDGSKIPIKFLVAPLVSGADGSNTTTATITTKGEGISVHPSSPLA
ncbi:hypothetical protein FRB95_013929 [Tulasnella sp. JGI-2019a]|nr:hypothetical protein FRB95_013929 [Tulasnella sp. JGI-2019a]